MVAYVAGVIVFLMIVISLFIPIRKVLNGRHVPGGGRMKCQRNMKTLGELLASINDIRKKPGPECLGEQFYIDLVFRNLEDSPRVLLCPGTLDEVDEDWDKRDTPPLYRTDPRNCSYFGPRDAAGYENVMNAGSDDPIGGEHFGNHPDGVNVLFGDTHVNFYEWKDFGFLNDEDPTDPFGRDWSDEEANIDLMSIGGLER